MLLNYKQAAEYLNCGERTVERLVSTGEIPSIEVGKRCRRIHPCDLDGFI